MSTDSCLFMKLRGLNCRKEKCVFITHRIIVFEGFRVVITGLWKIVCHMWNWHGELTAICFQGVSLSHLIQIFCHTDFDDSATRTSVYENFAILSPGKFLFVFIGFRLHYPKQVLNLWCEISVYVYYRFCFPEFTLPSERIVCSLVGGEANKDSSSLLSFRRKSAKRLRIRFGKLRKLEVFGPGCLFFHVGFNLHVGANHAPADFAVCCIVLTRFLVVLASQLLAP